MERCLQPGEVLVNLNYEFLKGREGLTSRGEAGTSNRTESESERTHFLFPLPNNLRRSEVFSAVFNNQFRTDRTPQNLMIVTVNLKKFPDSRLKDIDLYLSFFIRSDSSRTSFITTQRSFL